MKKTAKQVSIKPIALVVAIAAGATLSFAASALPVASSNSLSAVNGIVNEDICAGNTSTVIAGGVRTTTTSSTQCQNRNLDPTTNFAGAITTPSVPVVADSAAMVKHGAAGDSGQELYIADVGGKREAAVTFTPSRAMSVSRYMSANTVTGMSSNLGVNVNSAVGGNAGWLTGTYTFVDHKHGFRDMTGGIQDGSSMYGGGNYLGTPYDSEASEPDVSTVAFNGDGTCTFVTTNAQTAYFLTKDPNNIGLQPDGSNYELRAPVSLEQYGETMYTPGACSYTWSGADVVSLTLGFISVGDPGVADYTFTTAFNVSKDLRYLTGTFGNDNPALILDFVNLTYNQGLTVGIRNGAATGYVGRTYLYNAPSLSFQMTTSAHPDFENPLTAHLLEQQIECMARGSITLSAAGVCSVASEVSTCAARGVGGYGETSIGGGDGSLVDNLSSSQGTTTPTTCAYTVAPASGSMTVTLGITTPDGPSNITMNGQISDNGEAFAVTGMLLGMCVGGAPCADLPAPDVDNPAAIPSQTFILTEALIATAYDGSLAADTDTNGLTNLKDFQWAKLVFPASSREADTDGDGNADIVTWNQTTGNGYQYLMNGNNLRAAAPNNGTAFVGLLPASNAKQAIKDFNRDGANDVLMRNTSTGVWTMQMGSIGVTGMTPAVVALPATLTTTLQGLADYNRDGYLDAVLRDSGTGAWSVYYLQGSTVLGNGAIAANTAVAWQVAATGDFNGDGYADLLIRNTGTFAWFLYEMENNTVIRSATVSMAGSGWNLDAVGDFNNDGVTDVMVRQASTGNWYLYAFNDFAHLGAPPTGASRTTNGAMAMTIDTAWTTLGAADYDGNGTTDMLIFRNSTKTYYLYGLGGATGRTNIGSTVLPMTTGTTWSFQQAADWNGDGKYDFMLRESVGGKWHAYGFNSYTAGSVWSYYGYAPVSVLAENTILK